MGMGDPRSDVSIAPHPAERDETAWMDVVYADHAASVRAVASRLCGYDGAEDVTQEVFAHLWLRPEQYDPDRGSMRTYLLTVCRGKAVDRLRSDGARRARELAELSIAPETRPEIDVDLLQRDQHNDLRQCMDQLPEAERAAINAAFFGGRSYRQAAAFLGESEGTVKSRIRSGLARLHTLLMADATPRRSLL